MAFSGMPLFQGLLCQNYQIYEKLARIQFAPVNFGISHGSSEAESLNLTLTPPSYEPIKLKILKGLMVDW